MSKSEQDKLTNLLGRMIFSCGLPFSIVESPAFNDFLKGLRPSFQVPSRKTIGDVTLAKVYESVKFDIEKYLHGDEYFALQYDFWSNIRQVL